MNLTKILELKNLISELHQLKGTIESPFTFFHEDQKEMQTLSSLSSNKVRSLITKKRKELMYELLEWDDIPIEDKNLDPWDLTLKELNISKNYLILYGLKEGYTATTMSTEVENSTYPGKVKENAEEHLIHQMKIYLVKKLATKN